MHGQERDVTTRILPPQTEEEKQKEAEEIDRLADLYLNQPESSEESDLRPLPTFLVQQEDESLEESKTRVRQAASRLSFPNE
jgi:hypothetical protein